MRLSLGCKGEGESESGSDGVDVVFSWVCGFAGLLPVVSGVLVAKSLIINGISFSGNGAVLLVVLGFISLLGCRGWHWRNAFLSPCNMVSRFSVAFATELWLLKGSLLFVSGVLVFKSLVINGFSFSDSGVLSANVVVAAWG